MRPYETMVVLSNELGGELDKLVTRLKTLIQENGGTLGGSHDWGNRRLAYTIGKQSDGRYFLFEYDAEPDVVRELERTLRITDGVLRYLSVQQDHTGLPPERRREPIGREQTPLHEMRSTPAGSPRESGRDSSFAAAGDGDAESGESAPESAGPVADGARESESKRDEGGSSDE